MIDSIIGSLQSSISDSSQGKILLTDLSLRDNLRIGDIIEAKVLQHYDGSRYTVSIDGKEKVVDSGIPLNTGEILHGRVIGISNDKIILNKVIHPTQENNPVPDAGFNANITRDERIINEVFDYYLASLTPKDKSLLIDSAVNTSSPQLIALIGLVLNKIGLPIKPVYLKALEKYVHAHDRKTSIKQKSSIRPYDSTEEHQIERSDVAKQIAIIIANTASLRMDTDRSYRGIQTVDALSNDELNISDLSGRCDKDSTESGDRYERLGEWILNAQSHDSVAHRLLTMPIILNGKLIEVDMSFFSQKQCEILSHGQRSKRLVFSLQLENLGELSVEVKITDRHLKISIVSDRDESTQIMAKYLSELKNTVTDENWVIDDIQYITRQGGNAAILSVLNHHISQDHISRLL